MCPKNTANHSSGAHKWPYRRRRAYDVLVSGMLKRDGRDGVARARSRAHISPADISNICACAFVCVCVFLCVHACKRLRRTSIYLPSFFFFFGRFYSPAFASPPVRGHRFYSIGRVTGIYDFRPYRRRRRPRGRTGARARRVQKKPRSRTRRRHLPDKTYDKRVYATGIYYYCCWTSNGQRGAGPRAKQEPDGRYSYARGESFSHRL